MNHHLEERTVVNLEDNPKPGGHVSVSKGQEGAVVGQ